MEKTDPQNLVTSAVRRAASSLLAPLSNRWLTRSLEVGLQASLAVQAFRYYRLGAKRPNNPLSKASFYASYPNRDPSVLFRGFYTRQVVRPGARVLTIGCGDGFNDYLFLSRIAGSVDAVDIQRSAIASAKSAHRAATLHYHTLDVTREAFPKDSYDVVVMDGCIAHFAAEAMDPLLGRIAAALTDDGFYVGSEVMESPNKLTHDHLQAFPSTEYMKAFLERWFPIVTVWRDDTLRFPQVFWRCAKTAEAFRALERRRESNTIDVYAHQIASPVPAKSAE